MRVDIVADSADRDPGYVGERLIDAHGARLVFHDRDQPCSPEGFDGSELVLLLGSARSAHSELQIATVEAEAELVRRSLDSGTPVMGICYGAQLMAHALGGTVGKSDRPEIGWFGLQSNDRVLCPQGPWTQFHSDSFTAPPTARELGTTASGCQGFADENRMARAIGWQFHPEVTTERFTMWVERLREYCLRHGANPDDLILEAESHEDELRQAAYELTDAALNWLLT